MPQGSYLGPLTFVILIDLLRPGCLTHKFVDDTTMTEILDKSAVSCMQTFTDELVQQATDAGINVNGHNLLGVHVANDVKCLQHVDAISSKVSSKLYFLKQLKRSDAGPEDLLYFSVMAIRPVLGYACPVWHSCLTAAQTKALESLQRTAMNLIFPDNDYLMSLIFASVDTLESRR